MQAQSLSGFLLAMMAYFVWLMAYFVWGSLLAIMAYFVSFSLGQDSLKRCAARERERERDLHDEYASSKIAQLPFSVLPPSHLTSPFLLFHPYI